MGKASYRWAAVRLGVLRLPGSGVLEQTMVVTGVEERHARLRRQNICRIAAEWKHDVVSIGCPVLVVHGRPALESRECRMTAHVPQSPWQRGKGAVGVDARECRAREPDSLERRWGVVLAGGDGLRLRGLTRFAFGDDRPKQFCPFLGKDTLLQEARQRAERSISPSQILYSLTRSHQNYYLRDLGDRPYQRVVQPCNKGTAPAVLYTLLHIARIDRDAVVAILPCDHYYSRENAFTAVLESAFTIAEAGPESIVLVGAQPRGPEVEYGWIELGDVVAPGKSVFHVTKFHEKPPLPIAEHLLRIGSLWNTFVMVGYVNAFLDLALAWVPDLLRALRSAPPFSTSHRETGIAEIYDRIDRADFSRKVLSPGATRLLTLQLGQVEWNDLGDPDRVISTLIESGVELPAWATRWLAGSEADQHTAQRMPMAIGKKRTPKTVSVMTPLSARLAMSTVAAQKMQDLGRRGSDACRSNRAHGGDHVQERRPQSLEPSGESN